MIAGCARAAGAMLAAGLFFLAAGCSGPAAKAPRPGPPPVPVQVPGGFPAGFVGVSSPGGDGVVAVYSATDGRLIRTLTVPMPGGGPGGPQLSPDLRYLIYDTVPCGPSGRALVHICDLSTGRERTRAVTLGSTFSVFLDHDSEVVGGTGTGLEVLRMPSMAVTAYPAPPGCRYQVLAGTQTETGLVACCSAVPVTSSASSRSPRARSPSPGR